ncbi:MAG: AbrB family transcriptional regulator [Geminicoccaceae bacterium]|nr:AbrB family transcriptional regulator [Geminicoccaceae bacterium]
MKTYRPVLLALVLGAGGGAVFFALALPLPWMLGAMLATTVAAMSGVPVSVPSRLRNPMMAVIGVLLGSNFTLDVMAGAWRWLPTIATLPVYVVVVGGASYFYLRRTTDFDPRTAYFAAAPGGFGEMVLMGEQAGGDMRRIALVHSVRVLLIVLVVPFFLRYSGLMAVVAAAGDEAGAALPALLLDWLVLAVCAVLGAWLGIRLRLPAAMMLGPMVISALAHVAGLAHTAPPSHVVALAQIVIGSQIGSRFAAFRVIEVLRTMIAGVGLMVVMFAATFVVGAVVHLIIGTPVTALLLALAPGGVAEMSLIALATGVEPAFVATHHIVRIALVVALAPLLFRLMKVPAASPPGKSS